MKIGITIAILLVAVAIIALLMKAPKSNNSQAINIIKNDSTEVYTSIFYHEDDYGQVEIIPAENFNQLIKQAENVQEFAKKHFDGVGYTDMMLREDNEYKLKQLGIKSSELEEILSQLSMQKYNDVTTGIRPDEMKSENTIGYGENYNGLFFDFDSGIVTGIWIAGSINTEIEILTKVLNEIGQKWNLLLMDWNSLELVDLKNKGQIEKYLK